MEDGRRKSQLLGYLQGAQLGVAIAALYNRSLVEYFHPPELKSRSGKGLRRAPKYCISSTPSHWDPTRMFTANIC